MCLRFAPALCVSSLNPHDAATAAADVYNIVMLCYGTLSHAPSADSPNYFEGGGKDTALWYAVGNALVRKTAFLSAAFP
eukprot:COSAG06_NODE_5511_length_3435_cov_2.062350_2_plen_79_part_00